MGFQPCNLEMKREEARKVLSCSYIHLPQQFCFLWFSVILDLITNSVKTLAALASQSVGINSTLYEDLRCREYNLQRNSWPANSKNHSQADDEFCSKSLAEVTAKLSETLAQVTSLKEANSRIRTEASQAAIENRKATSALESALQAKHEKLLNATKELMKEEAINGSEAATLREAFGRAEAEKEELTAAWNFVNFPLKQNEAESEFLYETNSSKTA
jgi:hypothetical protein